MIIEYEELRTTKPRSGDKILSCLRHFTFAKNVGDYYIQELTKLQQKHECIGDVRVRDYLLVLSL